MTEPEPDRATVQEALKRRPRVTRQWLIGE